MPKEGVEGDVTGAAPPDAAGLADRLAALPDLPVPALRNIWTSAWGAPPPKGARRRLLVLGIAWQWQVRIHGGLSRATERRLAALEASIRETRGIDHEAGRPPPRLLPGARLVRVWRGVPNEVHVSEQGLVWRGETHASLSAVARRITGRRRNGPAFFGLRDRGGKG